MTRVAILTPTITSADAVSNDVFGMWRVLSGRGHDVQIFADDWGLSEQAIRHSSVTKSFLQDDADAVLIYHHSIGWDQGIDILEEAQCRTIIKYHNVTPAEFFEGISSRHSSLCKKGRLQLSFIARSCHNLFLAASAYNMNELLAEGAGLSQTFIVPPFNQVDSLQSIAPDLGIIDRYTDGKTNLLMVGGIRPNKGHVALIEAFATYYYHFDCNSRLLVIGGANEAFETYSRLLRELTDLLCLDVAVVFTGEVSASALKAYYLVANAFMLTSEHEGFCVPLVEAMAMRLPIIAYESAAIGETARDVGLVWPERDPFLMAESIDYLVQNEESGAALGLNGGRRYEQRFSNEAIEKQFLDVLTEAGFDL
jgi:glycosyltransferase involved in cell wall biosynthesis